MTGTVPVSRRRVLSIAASLLVLPSWPSWAQSPAAFPFYSGEQALQGLYGHLMPPLAQAFETEARALTAAARRYCSEPASKTALQDAWRRSLLAWQALSSPALGPVIERRSQRQIDFWPARPALLAKALAQGPTRLEDMVRIGTPAKGFPAMEWLLGGVHEPAHCPYLVLIAEGIEAEAQALRAAFDALAVRDWSTDEAAARSAFAEWINQWLGGLERLRWMHIEQPVQRARTAGHGRPPAFARQTPSDNTAEWRSQWQALLRHAQLNTPHPGFAKPPEGVQSFLGRPGERFQAPNPGFARPPEGVQSFLGRPGERFEAPNPGFARPPEGVQSFLGRPGERLETSEQRMEPPQPGQAAIPIEALLMGKGHIALAQRWRQTLDTADTAMRQLTSTPDSDELMALSHTLKSVTTLYQAEVAAALDVPLGFSDADGD